MVLRPIFQRIIDSGLPAVAHGPESLQYFRIEAKHHLLLFPAARRPSASPPELLQFFIGQRRIVLVGKCRCQFPAPLLTSPPLAESISWFR